VVTGQIGAAAERRGFPDGHPDGKTETGVPDMMPYQTYQVYEAGRPRTVAERRDADLRLGQIAVAASRLWCDATRPVRALRGLLHQSRDSWADERTHYTTSSDAAIPVP